MKRSLLRALVALSIAVAALGFVTETAARPWDGGDDRYVATASNVCGEVISSVTRFEGAYWTTCTNGVISLTPISTVTPPAAGAVTVEGDILTDLYGNTYRIIP